jgi:hypothetical protein
MYPWCDEGSWVTEQGWHIFIINKKEWTFKIKKLYIQNHKKSAKILLELINLFKSIQFSYGHSGLKPTRLQHILREMKIKF